MFTHFAYIMKNYQSVDFLNIQLYWLGSKYRYKTKNSKKIGNLYVILLENLWKNSVLSERVDSEKDIKVLVTVDKIRPKAEVNPIKIAVDVLFWELTIFHVDNIHPFCVF